MRLRLRAIGPKKNVQSELLPPVTPSSFLNGAVSWSDRPWSALGVIDHGHSLRRCVGSDGNKDQLMNVSCFGICWYLGVRFDVTDCIRGFEVYDVSIGDLGRSRQGDTRGIFRTIK